MHVSNDVFLDFVHRLVFRINWPFRKTEPFPSSNKNFPIYLLHIRQIDQSQSMNLYFVDKVSQWTKSQNLLLLF